MIAPSLTQEWFDECCRRGLSHVKAISTLNAKNCKRDFSKTIPKVLREDEEFNAYLIIKNHRDRFKYIGMKVENIKGALHITKRPEFIWAGYVSYENRWYAVASNDLIKGRIPDSSRIVLPEIEH